MVSEIYLGTKVGLIVKMEKWKSGRMGRGGD
jgi:hypothetical protein